MKDDSAFPSIFLLMSLVGIAIIAVTCSSCASTEAFPFRGQLGYAPETNQLSIKFESSK